MVTDLVLSLFPGIDLLGRAFVSQGYCVVLGPDLLWGQDIGGFFPLCDTFGGVIAGSPCQDFSRSRRAAPTGQGVRALAEFARVVGQARPAWWLLENVVGVPDVHIEGYTTQRLNLNARECGSPQHRLRCFQFGSRDGVGLVLHVQSRARPGRCDPPGLSPAGNVTCDSPAEEIRHDVTPERCCMASEGSRADRRDWGDFCELMGLPRDFELPGMTRSARYRAVGNGVPLPMGRVIARAIRDRHVTSGIRVCVCQCGRPVQGAAVHATAACRKRMERRRHSHGDVTEMA